ncbi:unnamed protein product, partial [Choristocarpus tenellus]
MGAGDKGGGLRIHLKRSCRERKPKLHDSGRGLTTDDWHKFKRLLATKSFAPHDTQRIRGGELTVEWLQEGGFREPVIVTNKEGLGLKV